MLKEVSASGLHLKAEAEVHLPFQVVDQFKKTSCQAHSTRNSVPQAINLLPGSLHLHFHTFPQASISLNKNKPVY